MDVSFNEPIWLKERADSFDFPYKQGKISTPDFVQGKSDHYLINDVTQGEALILIVYFLSNTN